MAIDPIYFDPQAEYANQERFDTGNELAGTTPGFAYMGPVAGEEAARTAWNQQAIMEGPIQQPDYTGNAFAAQYARQFDAQKAAADFERQTREAYLNAQTAQQFKAVQAAERHIGLNNIASDLSQNIPAYDSLARNYKYVNPADARNVMAMQPPSVRDFGEGIGKAVVSGGRVQFPPVSSGMPTGEIKGEQIMDEGGNAIPGVHAVRSRTGVHIIRDAPTTNPSDRLRVSGELPAVDPRLAPTRYSGPLTAVQERFGTNLPPALRGAPAASTVKEVIRTTKDGRKAIFDSQTKRFIRYAE